MAKSRQPKYNQDQLKQFYTMIERWVEEANLVPPPYGVASMARDQWLRAFWPKEPIWAGVLDSVTSIDKNRGWTLTGGRNQVAQYTSVLREADNGAGWRRYIGKQALSYRTANIGAITELGFDAIDGSGPLRALWNVDSARCELTGKQEYPLRYYPSTGAPQDWKQDWYIRAVSMESTDEIMLGLGRCATDMAIELATIMVAIWRHDKEMLFARMQKGLLLMKGVNEGQWEDAMTAHTERLTAKEREFFGGLSIFFGDASLDAKLIALSQLWEGFSLGEWVNILINGYALIMGYDPSEFWPVPSGAFGRGTEAEIQAVKATGKGGLDFILAYQDNLQRELPATLLFEFEQRNEKGDILNAEVTTAWATAINTMAQPSAQGLPPTLTEGEKRQLLAQHGLIPDDWTLEEEDVTATDTGATAERMAGTIQRAVQAFPGQSIVRYHWPTGKEQVLWEPARITVKRLGIMPITSKKRTIAQVTREYNDRLSSAVYGAINKIENAGSIPYSQMERLKIKTAIALREEHRGLIRELASQAYGEGMREGGVDPKEMDEEDNATIIEWETEQISYTNSFAYDVVNAAASDEQNTQGVIDRIPLWVKSMETLGGFGLISAKQNSMGTWKLDAHHTTNEHCATCERLNGQRYRLKWFKKQGFIPRENGSTTLDCGGWECGCGIVSDSGELLL